MSLLLFNFGLFFFSVGQERGFGASLEATRGGIRDAQAAVSLGRAATDHQIRLKEDFP